MSFAKTLETLRLINVKLVTRSYSHTTFNWTKSGIPVVPIRPVERPSKLINKSSEVELGIETVNLIERLSLVRFNEEEGAKRLKEAICFANQLFEIDTTNVEPLYTVLENRALMLRDDECNISNSRESLLKSAVKTDENYFVAPPGNIPLDDK